MLSSTSKIKFLLDENVRAELFRFLKSQGMDVNICLKGVSDDSLAKTSLKENRIIITNDSDFAFYSENQVFGVVLLKIPQNEPKILLKLFEELFKTEFTFEKKLIILNIDGPKIFKLGGLKKE